MEKKSEKPKLRGIQQNNWYVLFMTLKIINVKERPGNYYKLQEIKETCQ